MECVSAFDLSPGCASVEAPSRYSAHVTSITKGDATKFKLSKHYDRKVDFFITNPPWLRSLLHPIIFNLYWQRPTWLLLDSAWISTEQAGPYMPMLRKVVTVGRLKWIPNTPDDAKDDCAWHLFAPAGDTTFFGRAS